MCCVIVFVVDLGDVEWVDVFLVFVVEVGVVWLVYFFGGLEEYLVDWVWVVLCGDV